MRSGRAASERLTVSASSFVSLILACNRERATLARERKSDLDPTISTCDDDNDTLLFEQLQQYVLAHYPNPDRVDCLDSGTLAALVYAPEALELEDLGFFISSGARSAPGS